MVPLPQRHLRHIASRLGGIHARLLVVLHTGHGAADTTLIDVIPLADLPARRREAGVDIPGHDGAHRHPEGPQLIGQRHGVGVHRRLGGGIIRLEWDRHRRRHGAEVHDAAAARRPHKGRHRAVHIHHTEEIHIEQSLGVLRGGELHRTGDAESRVVHQKIDAALPRHDLRHGGADRLLLRHVSNDVVQSLHALGAAGQLIYGAAGLLQGQRRGPSDAGRAAGDNGHLVMHEPSPRR